MSKDFLARLRRRVPEKGCREHRSNGKAACKTIFSFEFNLRRSFIYK
jgi:hypothetical protein